MSVSQENVSTHDTGPIRTGQDTLREGVMEGTRRDNYTAHHTARTPYKHCYNTPQATPVATPPRRRNGVEQGVLAQMRTCLVVVALERARAVPLGSATQKEGREATPPD